MYSNNRYKGVDKIIVSIVSKTARKLIQSSHFSECDLEDLEQELLMDILAKIEQYKPDKSSLYGFIKKTLNNKAIDLIRYESSKKRGCKTLMVSLDENLNEEATSFLIDVVSEEMIIDNDRSTAIAELEYELHLKSIIKLLPPDLAQLFELLQVMDINSVIKVTGISRRTIYRKLNKLKRILTNFDEFL